MSREVQLVNKNKMVSYKTVIRAGKKNENASYLAYNIAVVFVFVAVVFVFYFLWKNPELLSGLLTDLF